MKTPIFYYHSIGGPPPQTLSLERFREHLAIIAEVGAQTVTLSDLLLDKFDPHKKQVVLTFDDGLLDNFDNALSELLRYKFVATFFVVPGYDNKKRWVNPKTGAWSDERMAGYDISFESMKASHRRELVALNMEIGSHTLTHRKLTKITASEAAREITQSKSELEDELGITIKTFCYPNGRFNGRLLRAVREADYLGACSTIPGYFSEGSARFRLPRFLTEDPMIFRQIMNGNAFSPYHWVKTLSRKHWRIARPS